MSDAIEGVSRGSRCGKGVRAEFQAQPGIEMPDLVGVLAAGLAGAQVSAEAGRIGGFQGVIQPGMD